MVRNSSGRSEKMKNRTKGRSTAKRKSRQGPADEWNLDELVKTEIDAAEALAAFSQQAYFTKALNADDSIKELRWLRKRKRSRKCQMECSSSNVQLVVSNSAVDFPMVKEEDLSDSDKERPGNDVPLVTYNRFDTSEDSLERVFRAESPSSPLPPLGTESSSTYVKMEVGVVQESAFKPVLMDFEEKPELSSKYDDGGKQRTTKFVKEKVKAEKMDELRIGLNMHTSVSTRKDKRGNTNDMQSSTGSKGRGTAKAILTEEEKEVRRLRRIEANRESARQTIRRKQIMCEELTKRANELVSANEKMKQEREILKQECRSLHERNYSLRQQLVGDVGVHNDKYRAQPATTNSVSLPHSKHSCPRVTCGLTKLQAADAGSIVEVRTRSDQDSATASMASPFGMAMHMWLSARNMQLPPFFHRPDRVATTSASLSALCPGDNPTASVSVEPTNCCNVQVNMQVDNVESVDSATDPAASDCSRPVQQGASVTSAQLAPDLFVPNCQQMAKLVSASGLLVPPNGMRGFFKGSQHQHQHQQQQRQQLHYSFYTGRKDAVAAATAAQARRRRKELTRSKNLLSRQVSLNL